ncbi:hypothetical protein ACWEN3_00110 [Streptomyces sp. NPDC004561]
MTDARTDTPGTRELWRLAEPGRGLDAGIIHLSPGQPLNARTEADPDVLLLVLTGDATVATARGPRHLTEGTLLWVPSGSSAHLTAGENGLSCLMVHRRLPDRPPEPAAADPAGHGWPKWLC